MLMKEYDDRPPTVYEAQENLRVIRELMERSTKHSTFSGFSGIFAGLISIVGCLVQHFYILSLPDATRAIGFLVNWSLVLTLAVTTDYFLTKRRARMVGKNIISPLGKQMVMAAAPGLGFGALLTLAFVHNNQMSQIYPYWMLAYGCAVSAVGLFSQPEVRKLGWAFLCTGALTLLLQVFTTLPIAGSSFGLVMTAISFGGFHIVYSIVTSRRG